MFKFLRLGIKIIVIKRMVYFFFLVNWKLFLLIRKGKLKLVKCFWRNII